MIRAEVILLLHSWLFHLESLGYGCDSHGTQFIFKFLHPATHTNTVFPGYASQGKKSYKSAVRSQRRTYFTNGGIFVPS